MPRDKNKNRWWNSILDFEILWFDLGGLKT